MRWLLPGALLLAACSDYDLTVFEEADVFYQSPVSEVDILLVIDDSCSMEPYQQELSTNFDEFISFFIEADVDYQIGVVTTSVVEPAENPGAGCGPTEIADVPPAGELVDQTFITVDTPDADQVFQGLVNVGICGSGVEMGLEAAYQALTEPNVSTANAGFLRDDASLSVIFVADEEDSSPLPTYQYVNAFLEVKGQRDRDVFNASALVISDPSECSAQAQASGSVGDRYIDVAEQTNGVLGNICASDFEDIVTDLSLNTSRLQDTFYLSDMPNPATIQVSINEEDFLDCNDGQYTYDLVEYQGAEVPAIIFEREFIPPSSSQLAVRYDRGGGDPADFCTEPTAEDVEDTGGAR